MTRLHREFGLLNG